MKRLILLSFILFVLTGCTKVSGDAVINTFSRKIKNTDSYYMTGKLEVTNNDDVYNYDVEVSFEKKEKYRVVLTNNSNGAVQIILRNKDGVFILTPNLNRCFKFQSDWPYNNSSIYLLHALVNDLKGDVEFKNLKDKYELECGVDYPNNSDLVKEKITINNKFKLDNVVVYDKNNIPVMKFNVKKLDFSPSFKEDYFDTSNVMSEYKMDITKSTSKIDESIYPLILPTNTSLVNEERIDTGSGERILMTFDGDSPFLLVEETVSKSNEFNIIPTSGEPINILDTIGVMTNNSISWVTGDIEYYIVSDVLSSDELKKVAESMYVLPTSK